MGNSFKSAEYIGVMAALVATVLWGGAYIAMKFALQSFHPISMIFFRLFIASCISLLFCLY